jgi:hypothetical protein
MALFSKTSLFFDNDFYSFSFEVPRELFEFLNKESQAKRLVPCCTRSPAFLFYVGFEFWNYCTTWGAIHVKIFMEMTSLVGKNMPNLTFSKRKNAFLIQSGPVY